MCLESVGIMKVIVKCDRGIADIKSQVSVHYRTVPDTAGEGTDYIHTEGTLTFAPGETEYVRGFTEKWCV